MNTALSALVVVALCASAASSAETFKTKESWTRTRSVHSTSGAATHHSASVHSAGPMIGGRTLPSSNGGMSSLPSYGGSSGPGGHGGTVPPLRAMARSRTSGAGGYVPGGAVQGRGYATEAAAPAKTTSGGGSPIFAKEGRSLAGPGVAKGAADTPPGGGASGAGSNDPMSKIMAGLGAMFGDMAKSMSAMWGGGG